MTGQHQQLAATVQQLFECLEPLERRCALLNLDPLAGREWFELLRQKLIPQLSDDAFLVVAVVGGTNIGKSVLFNHIAGCRVSATSPLASGTKHPVCLVPSGFAERHDLRSIFPGFRLDEWTDSDAALQERDEHIVFWRTSNDIADNLLVLDTPDIDSDARVNWVRADAIRRCADVLIAVLTQQKYNDAAVKTFFRRAAAEDKAVIVVFNQCLLPEDETYWPVWLETFCNETHVVPRIVYIIPNDRRAAEDNRLEFHERPWSSGASQPPLPEEASCVLPANAHGPRSLADDLSWLRFEEIKLRSLRGAIREVLHPHGGIPGWLTEVLARSGEFQAAATRFSSESVVRIRDWPNVTNRLLVDEVRRWWKSRQEGWSRRINGAYDAVGSTLAWPFRAIHNRVAGEPVPALDVYREREWSAILMTVEEIFDRMEWMLESGSDLLKPRLEQLLAGKSRAGLLKRLRNEHQQLDMPEELKHTVAEQMRAFREDSPELYRFYRQLNNISAAVRPMTSVVLFSLGWGPAGEAVAPFVADAAAQAVVPIIADMAGGATTAVAGEAAVSGAAASGAGFLHAKFQRLRTAFTARRVDWLGRLLKHELLGTLPDELLAAATIPQSDAFLNVRSHVGRLEQHLASEHHVRT